MKTNTLTSRTFRGIHVIALAVAALAGTFVSTPAARAELLANGSFETLNPAGLYFATDAANVPNWDMGGTVGNHLVANGTWAFVTSVPDGSNFVGLKNGASFSQTFSSPSAGSATLTFDFWNGNFQFNHVDDLIWSLNGTEVGNSLLNSAAHWVHVSVVVTLLEGPNTLTFTHSNPGNGDVIALDNVNLEATASAPAVPTDLAATAGNAQVDLTWTASSGAEGYNVKRSETSGTGYATIGTPSGTSYTDSTASNDTTYFYVVSATNIVGESADSSPEVSAMPSLPPPPSAPPDLGATAGNATVALTWTASSGATSYNVKRSETSGSGYATLGTPSGTGYIDSTAANGTTYYYVVSASNAGGEGVNSSEVSATPLATASLVANGSFEILNPAGIYWATDAANVPNWGMGGAVSNHLVANGPWAFVTSVPDGSNFVGLKNGASFSQTFSSPTAGSATLTFDFWNGNFQFNHVDDLIWSLNGTEVGNSLLNSAAHWVHVSVVVTLLEGPNTLTFTHSNPGNGDVITLDNVKLLATTSGGSTYADWASTNGAGTQTMAEDHDNDGVSNGVEYFLGGNTDTTGFTALPGVVKALDNKLSVTWTKAAGYPGAYGVAADYVVETSTTLAVDSWTPEPETGGDVTVSGNNVTYTFPSGPVKFARLKVMGTP